MAVILRTLNGRVIRVVPPPAPPPPAPAGDDLSMFVLGLESPAPP